MALSTCPFNWWNWRRQGGSIGFYLTETFQKAKPTIAVSTHVEKSVWWRAERTTVDCFNLWVAAGQPISTEEGKTAIWSAPSDWHHSHSQHLNEPKCANALRLMTESNPTWFHFHLESRPHFGSPMDFPQFILHQPPFCMPQFRAACPDIVET